MKKTFSKIAGAVAVVALVASVSVSTASALTAADIQLLVSMGVISADKAAAAMAAVGGSTSTSTASCGTYTRDLTLGSTGADVVALQSFLESKGHLSIPTGVSKGYFGALTQSSLAKYQASVGISPAAGYFGPMTRAKVSGDCSTTGTGSTGSTGSLSGDEASLESYDSTSSYSNEDIDEGESAKVFEAQFDVEDGDVKIERVDVRVESVTETAEDEPWNQIEEIAVYINGDKVADMQVDDEDEWSREDSTETPSTSRAYEVRFTGLDTMIEEGEEVTVELEVTTSGNVDDTDLPQSWKIWIPTEGIRAIDGAGIDQYTGSNSESKNFTIEEAQDGDVTVRESDDDLDASILVVDNDDKKGPYEVFRFEIDNDDSADVLLNTLVVTASTSDSDITSVISDVMVEIDGEEFSYDTASTTLPANHGQYTFDFEDNDDEIPVAAGETIEVVVKAEFLKLSGNYTDGTQVQFGVGKINGSNLELGITAEGDSTGDAAAVSGRQEGAVHTLRREGIVVEGVSESATVDQAEFSGDIEKGIFEIEVEVTALEEDAYIQDSVSTSASSGAGFVISVTNNGVSFVGTTTAYISEESSDTETANRHKISEGTSETFTIRVELDPTGASVSQSYGISLDTIRFASSSDVSLVSFTVPDEAEFETSKVVID